MCKCSVEAIENILNIYVSEESNYWVQCANRWVQVCKLFTVSLSQFMLLVLDYLVD